MTGIEEAVVSHLVLKSGEKIRGFVVGKDTELRKAVRQALKNAVNDVALPLTVDSAWVVDAILEGGPASSDSASTTSGAETGTPLTLGAADFAFRLENQLSVDLVSDLKDMGVPTTEIFEAFGEEFPEVVSIYAMSNKSTLSALAARIEANRTFQASEGIAKSLGVNLHQVGMTLRRLKEESTERIYRRFDSLAVPESMFDTLMNSLSGIPLPSLEASGLLVMEADAGSGKSTIADRLHHIAIELAETDSGAPLPVLLQANRMKGSVREAIENLWGFSGELEFRKVDLVVDGLDEIGSARAGEIVLDIRSLLRGSSFTVKRALITLRPLDLVVVIDQHVEINLLSESQATALIEVLSEKLHIFNSLSPVIRNSIRRPFYAVAVGIAYRDANGHSYPTQSSIIESVVKRALSDVDWSEAANLLSLAAKLSVDARHGSVFFGDITQSKQDQLALEKSRLIRTQDNRLSFQAALIAEWFAAEYLRNNVGFISELVVDSDRLDLWRYPILLAVESQSFEQMEPLMSVLARKAPAMAGWILNQPDPFDLFHSGGSAVESEFDVGAYEFAKRMRLAFSTLGKGIGGATDGTPFFGAGELVPIALNIDKRRCSYAWHKSDKTLPLILTELPREMDPTYWTDWVSVHSATVSDHPAWIWRKAHMELRGHLETLIKSGEVFAGADFFDREDTWFRIRKALGRAGSRDGSSVRLDDLNVFLADRSALFASLQLENVREDAETIALRTLAAELNAKGVIEIASPFERPNNLESPSGWVWGLWTPEALLDRARETSLHGLELYEHAVLTQVQGMASQLRLAQAWPVSVVGFMKPADSSGGYESQPDFVWYIDETTSDVTSRWTLVNDMDEVRMRVYEDPTVHRWHMGELPRLYESNPATNFATELLLTDLREWGWAS